MGASSRILPWMMRKTRPVRERNESLARFVLMQLSQLGAEVDREGEDRRIEASAAFTKIKNERHKR